ncbi:DUF305 domain-containing protein [Streptosporangium sp. NPDC051022]|uniref:DUF305 domain-containing protein n=1 Tax=Streptosporangium sp. NPDC051022 TaxID=3155752 RepID=UPI00343DC068
MMKRAVPIVLGAFLLTGCGAHSIQELQGGGQLTYTPPGAPVAAPAADAGPEHNPADVTFLQMMAPHNTQVVKLVRMAESRNVRSDLKVLAAAIATTQEAETASMVAWLKGWNQPTAGSASNAHASHGGSGLTKAQFDALEKTAPADFEKKFINALIAQQDDAVQMAKIEKMAGGNAATKALADRIEASRSAQVKQLLAMLGQ